VQVIMALVIGVLFGVGTYMLLRPSLIRIVMGFGLYSNAANLLIMASGGWSRTAAAPFVGAAAPPFMDPLPPDIVLTAIVISFAVGALLLVISYRVYRDHGTDDPERLPSGSEP
jgi:multicomponent Na+:H+ antiporter subunit C